MKSRRPEKILLACADSGGNVYEYQAEPAFRAGNGFVRVKKKELIPLPYGSVLFSLPGRSPVYFDRKKGSFSHLGSAGVSEALASSAFLSSGYLRTYLPAFAKSKTAPVLPLWAYAGLVIIGGNFFVPGLRIDEDPRSDPQIHENDEDLARAIGGMKKLYPSNRLVEQLAYCSTGYRCLCARNFFLGRHEAPVPTTPQCNSDCVGCLSNQTDSGFSCSQERLNFSPTPLEISEVILHHLLNADNAVASFGQGCEGEPLLRAKDLAEAVGIVRRKTGRGTININTNGSLPENLKMMINAGIDSVRISLNSPTKLYYDRYYRQKSYLFEDVLKSIEISIGAGIYTSINLFFLPGFTDMETEAESLTAFLKKFPVNMIQARNLNIDPDYYLGSVGFMESPPIGTVRFLRLLKESFPSLSFGYYNPPKEKFSSVLSGQIP